MISGQARYAIPGTGWRHQASWAIGPLAVLGVILFAEEGPEISAAPRSVARVINQPPPREVQPSPPKVVSLLNANVETGPNATRRGDDAHVMPQEVEDELPNDGIRVRASNAARFRTWCVRLCDGFYFPVNYLTTRSRLEADDAQCRASCSSEARLYVNTVLGRTASPLADLSGKPYTELPTAFAYRMAVNPSCTCDGSRMMVTSTTLPPGVLDGRRR